MQSEILSFLENNAKIEDIFQTYENTTFMKKNEQNDNLKNKIKFY